eukprot:TRINITY_DN61923_c0_g1_i1.p1 TRINITY_DN61923_c0_g1~~TRINITY_DN61923_c0_g1_i1.p1  ORF type:complete len:476 (+),score=74.00 TRINITY_DN61923_c0_g1_i1:63-1490(+)
MAWIVSRLAAASRRVFQRRCLSSKLSSVASVYWPNELDASVSDGSVSPTQECNAAEIVPGNPEVSQDARCRTLSADIAEFAGRQPTPMRLEEILGMKTPDGLRAVLQEELPVRLANRIAHLDTLPKLEELDLICGVRADFVRAFSEVRHASDPDEFEHVIRRLKKRNENHALRMTSGMKAWMELRRKSGEHDEEEGRAFVDEFLDRLFLSRIGMETLTSQYLALSHNPDGIVNPNCDPCEVCERAAEQVVHMAKTYLKRVPDIEISFHGTDNAQTLPLIPQYLFYIVVELLKNSLRAVGESHEAQGSRGKPDPVEIIVASDESQVALSIMDKGGGIPFHRQPHVWSYMYTTARGNRVCEKTGILLEQKAEPTPLSGYGVGLPLSRLYAEYLGGSLHLMSMPNFGTHAYLFLQQSSEREEALPTYVNWLRRRRLREDILSFEAKEKDAAGLRDYAEALRFKTLAAEARVELSLLER